MNEPEYLWLDEFGDAHPLPASVKPTELKQYLEAVWNNRHQLYTYPETEPVPGEGKQPFLQFDGQCIRARNYAGIIHFQGVTIYLLPKIFRGFSHPGSSNPGLKTKPEFTSTGSETEVNGATWFFSHLHFYLSYCRHVHFPFQWQPLTTDPSDAWKYWIRLFATYTASLLHEQPYLTYQTEVTQTDYLRGKLAVQPYVNEQLTRGQWQRLQTEQQPFVLDNPFNRIVKYTVTRLLPLAGAEARHSLQEILHLLSEVALIHCTPDDCNAVYLNRLYPKHQQLLDMCRFFLTAGLGGSAPDVQSNFSFLLPMERVFEDFVAGFVQKHFPEWEAVVQKSIPLATGSNNRTLHARPDIWLPRHRTVLDTKYKRVDAPDLLRQIPATDIYQLFAYAVALQVPQVHLLYVSAGSFGSETIRLLQAEHPVFIHAHTLPVVLTDAMDTFPALTLRIMENLQKLAGNSVLSSQID